MPAPVRADAAGLEFAANIEVIIYFSVERNREAPAVALHRLRTGFRKVDNRQAAVADGDTGFAAGPATGGIGASVGKRVSHSPGIDGERAVVAAAGPEQTRDPAHQPVPFDEPSSSCRSCHCFATEERTGFSRFR